MQYPVLMSQRQTENVRTVVKITQFCGLKWAQGLQECKKRQHFLETGLVETCANLDKVFCHKFGLSVNLI